MTDRRLLVWSVTETAGFDAAWASLDGDRLVAEGEAVGQEPEAYSLRYRLETDAAWVTRRLTVESRTLGRTANLDLRRDDGAWTVDGAVRTDLAEALDCDLAACPLTNTMPILRHDLHRTPGDVAFLMAFVEVPSLRVVPSRQRYVTIRPGSADAPAVVGYRSDGFESDLEIDDDGFVLVYPKLGRRIVSVSASRGG
jgi:uncharacterized protein